MENELLPVLRDELPHLHVSPHALGRMWEQQMQQVDRLHVMSSNQSRHRSKLSREVRQWQLHVSGPFHQINGLINKYIINFPGGGSPEETRPAG